MLYLSDTTLSSLGIAPREMMDRIEHLIRGLKRGTASSAPKSTLYPGDGRLFMSTLSSSEDPAYMAVKSLGMNPANGQHNLEIIGAQIALFDGNTGLPIAMMDGTWITAVRTAALSAVAASRLADPESSTLTLVGCGAQARSHLDALADVFPLKRLIVVGRGQANIDALCEQARARGIDATATSDVADALAVADIVVTTIPDGVGFVPFLDAGLLKPHAFVSMVDLGRSWRPETLCQFDEIVIDDLVQEQQMKTPMLDLALVQSDLRTLVERVFETKGRRAFAFRGIALGDLALAGLCYERALDSGVGQSLET